MSSQSPNLPESSQNRIQTEQLIVKKVLNNLVIVQLGNGENHPILNAFDKYKIKCKCTYREYHDTCVHEQAWLDEDEFTVRDEEREVVGEHVIVEDGSNTPAYDCIKCGQEGLIDKDDFKKFYCQPGPIEAIPEEER